MVRLDLHDIDNGVPTNYSTIFHNERLGRLMRNIHALTIKTGNLLENKIIESCRDADILWEDFDLFLKEANNNSINTIKHNICVITKKAVKNSNVDFGVNEPDFLVFAINDRTCKVVELKWGGNFDTKKSAGEVNALRTVQTEIGQKLPFSVDIRICSFTAQSKSDIVEGFKGNVIIDEVMTGKEFCDELGLKYDDIVSTLETDAEANCKIFVDRLLQIDEVVNLIMEKISIRKSIFLSK